MGAVKPKTDKLLFHACKLGLVCLPVVRDPEPNHLCECYVHLTNEVT